MAAARSSRTLVLAAAWAVLASADREFVAQASLGSAGGPASVRAVLFVLPTCPHCRTVEQQALPAFAQRFGRRLHIAVVNTATPSGQDVFRAACRRFGVLRPGVPMLVVKDRVLIGSQEIPERFPDLAEGLLAAGESSWPDLPGLDALLTETASADGPASSAATAPPPGPIPHQSPVVPGDEAPGLMGRIAMDPYGNSLAVVMLVAMIAVAGRSVVLVRRAWPIRRTAPGGWPIPSLSLLGMAVASYLSWVEIGPAEAVCGFVGDCSAVQRSEYATLFGPMPIAVVGVVGFTATLVVWWAARFGSGRARESTGIALLTLTGFGTLVSIYLTFLEPFVIGATCLWCLGSALIMTLLHWLSLHPGRTTAVDRLQRAGRTPATLSCSGAG